MSEDKKIVRFDWFVKFMLRDKSNVEILEGCLSELLKEDIRNIEIVAKLTPAQRRQYERYLDEQRSIASHNETVQKDMEDAREEAREEGEQKARYTAAEKGLKKGLTVEVVAEITDLPIEIVIEIKQKIDHETSGR